MSTPELERSTRVYSTPLVGPLLIADFVGLLAALVIVFVLRWGVGAGVGAFIIITALAAVAIALRSRRFIVTPEGITVARLAGKRIELEWRHIRGIDIHSKAYQVHYVDAGATLSFADPTELALPESFKIPKTAPRSDELLGRIYAGVSALPKNPLTPEQVKAVEAEIGRSGPGK